MTTTYDRPLLEIASLDEIAKAHGGDKYALTEVWPYDSMTLYRGGPRAEQPAGIYWTPDKTAAKHYATQPTYEGRGVVRKATLTASGLSCITLMYEWGDNHTFQDIEGDLELDTLNTEGQRVALAEEIADIDVILMADDYTGHNHYGHMTVMIVTEKALRQLALA